MPADAVPPPPERSASERAGQRVGDPAGARDITVLLHSLRQGAPGAADDLLAVVYQQLRALAASRLRGERAGVTQGPTALVHEAWLRLGLMDFISQRLHAGGITAVPSDTMVALMAAGRHGTDVAAAHAASGARRIVVPSARHLADGWQVSLRLRERDGTQRIAEAHGNLDDEARAYLAEFG